MTDKNEWVTEGFIAKTKNPMWYNVNINNQRIGLIKRDWIVNMLDGKKEAAPIKSPPDKNAN